MLIIRQFLTLSKHQICAYLPSALSYHIKNVFFFKHTGRTFIYDLCLLMVEEQKYSIEKNSIRGISFPFLVHK